MKYIIENTPTVNKKNEFLNPKQVPDSRANVNLIQPAVRRLQSMHGHACKHI